MEKITLHKICCRKVLQLVETLFGHSGASELIAQFISTQHWPLEERSIELRKERGKVLLLEMGS